MSTKPRRRNRIPLVLLRLLFTGQLREKPCSHLHLIQHTTTDQDICVDCVATSDTWPALRMCMICGYVGCCDKSKNKHALKHFQATGHPLIRAVSAGEDWVWCYVDHALRAAPAG